MLSVANSLPLNLVINFSLFINFFSLSRDGGADAECPPRNTPLSIKISLHELLNKRTIAQLPVSWNNTNEIIKLSQWWKREFPAWRRSSQDQRATSAHEVSEPNRHTSSRLQNKPPITYTAQHAAKMRIINVTVQNLHTTAFNDRQPSQVTPANTSVLGTGDAPMCERLEKGQKNTSSVPAKRHHIPSYGFSWVHECDRPWYDKICRSRWCHRCSL